MNRLGDLPRKLLGLGNSSRLPNGKISRSGLPQTTKHPKIIRL